MGRWLESLPENVQEGLRRLAQQYDDGVPDEHGLCGCDDCEAEALEAYAKDGDMAS